MKYNRKSSCSVCGEVTVKQEEVAVLDHTIGDWTVVTPAKPGVAGLKAKACTVCGHVAEEQEIAAVKVIGFSGASLTLANSIAINYKINPNYFTTYGYERIYLVCTMAGKEYTVDTYTEEGGRLVFSFTNVASNMMSETVTATIYGVYDGVAYECKSVDYSVVQYTDEQLPYASGEFLTLLVDLLNYGTAAQEYTSYNVENLANAKLTEAQKAAGTQTDRTPESHMNLKYASVDNPTAKWRGASLLLGSAIVVRYTIAADDITGMVAKFTVDGREYTVDSSEFEVAPTAGWYYIYFNKLGASQLSAPILTTIYKDDVAISHTVQYSVESYVQENYTTTNTALATLIKAMLRYGDAAYAFAN